MFFVLSRVSRAVERNAMQGRIITPSSLELMANAKTYRANVATAFHGMRRGEILFLAWIRLIEDRLIKLNAKTQKTGTRKISICDELYLSLRSYHAIHDDILSVSGQPVKNIRTALARAAVILVGIRGLNEGFVFHDLRHTFNTLMRKPVLHSPLSCQ